MKFIVEQEVLEKTVTYLASRPWQEVNPIIALLAKVEPLKEEKTEE